jgi:hypothetical protein
MFENHQQVDIEQAPQVVASRIAESHTKVTETQKTLDAAEEMNFCNERLFLQNGENDDLSNSSNEAPVNCEQLDLQPLMPFSSDFETVASVPPKMNNGSAEVDFRPLSFYDDESDGLQTLFSLIGND